MNPVWAIVVLSIGVMMWMALPLLPAIIELYGGRDIQPLNVPPDHHRDLRHFARVFRDYVRGQLAQMDPARVAGRANRRRTFPDGSPVHIVTASTPYVSDLANRRRTADHERVLVSTEPLAVPDGVKELGEVYATRDLVGGADCVYRAVFCEGNVELGERSVVLRWMHAQGAVHARAGSQLPGRTTADVSIHVDEGAFFARLYAPRIVFGEEAAGADLPADAEPPGSSAGRVPVRRIAGDYTVPAHTRVAGDLIVRGNVTIGEHCVLDGSLKAKQLAEIGRGTQVSGSIVAVGNLYVAPDCLIRGAIVGESDVFIDERTRIGSAAAPTTVTAERIYVASSVVSHGLIWARRLGTVARF